MSRTRIRRAGRTACSITLGAIAGLLAVLLVLTVDAERMLLDTGAWTEATAVVLEDDQAREALALLLVQRGIARLECSSAVASLIAGSPVGARIGRRMHVEVEQLLASDRAGALWRTTNREAHAAFVRAARTDRPVGDDRLLDLGSMFDRAARVADLLNLGEDADVDARGDDSCSSASDGIAVLDPRSLRAAGDLASTLHEARRAPGYLVLALAVTLGLMAFVAGTVGRVGIGLVGAGLVALAGASFMRAFIDGDTMTTLVDGVRDPLARELAQATVRAALQPTLDHLAWLAVGAGVTVVIGGVLTIVGVVRRTAG